MPTKRAFVFPGQGSQYIGMGKEIYEAYACAKEVFQEVDETLKKSLSKVIFSGDEKDLQLTENAQPALMAVSIALLRVLENQGNFIFKEQAAFTAGHSLGEYSAFCAAGTFSLATTAHLLQQRGQAMQQAVPVGRGGMVALIGATLAEAEEVVASVTRDGVCEVANDNAPGQVVISGELEALNQAMAVAKEKGIKRSILLPVSAPFHSTLMQPAADKMREVLENASLQGMPSVSLISNITATPLETEDQIRPRLVDQITGRVRWVESMTYLAHQGVNEVVEVGAGKVLTGLMRRINPDISTFNIETPHDIETFFEKIAA